MQTKAQEPNLPKYFEQLKSGQIKNQARGQVEIAKEEFGKNISVLRNTRSSEEFENNSKNVMESLSKAQRYYLQTVLKQMYEKGELTETEYREQLSKTIGAQIIRTETVDHIMDQEVIPNITKEIQIFSKALSKFNIHLDVSDQYTVVYNQNGAGACAQLFEKNHNLTT